MPNEWFIVRDGKEEGPVSSPDLKELAETGKLQPDDRVRRTDMKATVKASAVKGLFPGIHDKVDGAVELVGRTAKTVGKVADAAKEVADATDKLRQAATSIAGIAGGISAFAGSIGDFLRPLGNINLIIFVLAGATAPVLILVARKQTKKALTYKYGAAAVGALAVAMIFGLWTGLAAVASSGDKGVLATNIKPIDRLQETVIPPPPPPVVVEAPKKVVPEKKVVTEKKVSIDFDPVTSFMGSLRESSVVDSRRVKIIDSKIGKAAQFDGKGWIKLKGNLPAGNSPRTMAMWMKNTRGPTDELVIVLLYGKMEPTQIFGIIEAARHWRFYDLGGGLDSGIGVDKEWHHHCICYDGKKVIYYFDGKAVEEVERELNTVMDRPMLLGAIYPWLKDQPENTSFVGQIAEFVLYDRALTAEQVVVLMKGEQKK